MKTRTVGWVVGSLGLLFGAGTARAQEAQQQEQQQQTSTGTANQAAQQPVCRDAGVTVSFPTASYQLDQNAIGALNGVATWMKADASRTLHLHGYADTTGNSESNLVLSEHRAQAVKDYLVSQGIDTSRIMTAGRGEDVGEQLPADGRTVTFLACQSATPPAPVAEAAPSTAVVVVPPAPIEVVPPPPPAPEPYPAAAATPPPWGSRFGWAFMAGGGYNEFTDNNMKSRTNGGGAWDARLVGGTNSILGFEAAYVGSAHTLDTLGLTSNTPTLVSNGVEGALRLNAPIRMHDSLLEPYGFVGVGWAHYTISNYNSNRGTVSDFNQSDDVMNVPVGGGIAYSYRAFIVDARAQWMPTYYNNLLPASSSTGTLNQWGVGGQVGFRF